MSRLAALLLLPLFCWAPAPAAAADPPQRALVCDFANTSRDRRALVARAAADALAMEMQRRDLYDVVPRPEADRAARRLGLAVPYGPQDTVALAREVGADLLVTGEVAESTLAIHDRQREYQVGLVVRVRDPVSGELVNGAAAWGSATAPTGGTKTEGALLIDAATEAASRASGQMASYRPIVGTVMNSGGQGPVVMNRGASHGVRARQEFVVLRAGVRVGKARAGHISPYYTDLVITESPGGIQPEDKVVAIFPEPKLGRPR